MKNFTYLILAGLFSFVILDSTAQTQRFLDGNQPKPARVIPPTGEARNRCLTMEALADYLRLHPEAKAMSESLQRNVPPEPSTQRTEAIVFVPVVFHIIGSAARQAQVTDADVLWQLNKLNEDYAGSNADSTNAAYGFYPIRAYNNYCQIRYCMAQRTGFDLSTNGIDRVVSTLNTSQNCGNTNLVKHASSGGADAWDPTRFFNVWVGEFSSCLLGIATFPGTGNANEQGVDIDFGGFSNNPAYVIPAFALGRTLVHESGHYWGLLHIWGDDAGCSSSDFRQIAGSTCVWPASLGGADTDQSVGDTPNQAGQTTNCPSGAKIDACSGSAPGINYQNYMDYTEDACYSMFTKKQVDRMQYCLDNCRASLKTSNGCTPPPVAAGNDARIAAIINPATGSTIGCSSVTPLVTIQNMGSNLLTTAKINVSLDAAAPVITNWTGSLTQGQSANVTLPALNIATVGSHTIKIYTTLPNGVTDAVPANDTATTVITRIGASPLPVTNGFETTFLPTGWSLNNPDNDDLAWFRFNPAGGASGGSVYAAVIDNYDLDHPATVDDIVTPVITTTGLLANDSLLIAFDIAYKNYPDPGFYDSLKIMVTNNCGATWTTIWAKGGPGLATAGSSTALYNPPAQGDWKTQKVSIGSNIFGAGQVQVAFRNVNFFGNALWLDNINIDIKPRKDMQTTAILRPNSTECAPPFIPSITVKNNGGENVTAFKTGYILNGGTPFIQVNNIPLAPGASATITFPSMNPPVGNNTIKMFVADPITASVGADGTPANDTLTKAFFVPAASVPNIVEGFEGATFPPAAWFLLNPDNSLTWQKTSPGKASNFSAFVDNYDYATGVYLFDYLQPPPINTAGADSLIISFDVAHKVYDDGTGPSVDNLSVLIARNCSATFSTVYSKTGTALATAGSAGTDAYTTPAQSDWRRDRVAVDLVSNPATNVVAQFRNGDAYGNNIFIDNINITPKFKRDIEVLSVTPDVLCTPGITPVATIRNRGTETVTAFKVSYSIGGGAAVTTAITGATLAPNTTTTVTLTAGTLGAGANSLKFYTSEPTTASGTGDQYTFNDTIVKTTYLSATVTPPLVETFEGGTFVPAGWALSNPDNSITWQKATTGFNSSASAYLRNFVYFANGEKDGLITPVFNFNGVDSVKVSFDLSAATKVAPNGTTPMDTLEVLVTRDCGNTFTSVYKKGGTQLQTIYDNTPIPVEYVPGAYYLWRKEYIDLTSFSPNGPLQLVFRNTTNNQNNVYIDNVNFATRTLPPRLKADGVIIAPNPFGEQFTIWYVQPPTDLRYVTVFNAAGQLIWNKVFGSGGSASNIINVDLTGKSAGFYIVNLGYGDKSKDKQIRIMKSN